MGYITTYSDTNKVTDTALNIRYSVRPVTYTLSASVQEPSKEATYYQVTRIATKDYSYVGMDKSTADSCTSAKRTQYYRDYAIIGEQTDKTTFPPAINIREIKSSIVEKHTGGGMWNVQIQVNETSVRPAGFPPTNPASLFTVENGWNYDEGGGGSGTQALTLNSAEIQVVEEGYHYAIRPYYTQQIENFDQNLLQLQFKTSESGQWQTGLRNDIGLYDCFASLQPNWVKLLYRGSESNTIQIINT